MDIEKIKREWYCRIVGVISGLLLAIPNIYSPLAPLQFLALLTILYLGIKRENKFSDIFTAGIYMGLFYTLPQMIFLRLSIPITIILLLYLVAIMTGLAIGSAWLIRRESFWGAFAVGAFLVVLDWVNFTIVPIWGTAQSIARPWSKYPELIEFSSLTGITGIVFVLGLSQALIVSAIVNPKIRRKLVGTFALVILIITAINLIIIYQKPVGKIKVAAIGWSTKGFKDVEYAQTSEGFEELYAKPAAKAAEQGARLIVSPEMGFYIDKYSRDEWFEKFGAIAKKYNVFLAIGYFNTSENQNRLVYITPDGNALPEYSKTYLIPYEEKYIKGNGRLVITDINGISAGGMICHDDNFTKFSREYGRKKVSIVAVPTLDWSTVKNTHLQNSTHRAIESRYAIVRATMNGISAIIAPGGKILASCDHFKTSPAVITAEVPVYSSTTLFSAIGHWPVGVCGLLLIIYVSRNFINIKKQRTENEYTRKN